MKEYIYDGNQYSKAITNNKKKNMISPSIMFLGIFIIFIFFCNDRYLGITQYYYFPIISIVCLLFYYIKNKLPFKLEHHCVIFLLFYLIMNLVRYDKALNTGIYLSYIIFLLMFLLITLKKVNEREIRFLINSYILSALFISILIIILKQELDGWIGTYRYTIKLMNDIYVDPNFIGAFINIPAIFTFNRIFIYKEKKYIYINIMQTFILCFAVLLTGSRSAMIGLILAFIIVFSCYFKFKIKNLFLGICIVGITIFILYNVIPNATIERMFFDSYYDDSNIKRLSNWEFGMKCFLIKPVFGHGFINTSGLLLQNFGYSYPIHNTYITFLNQFGIVGSVPIMIIIIKIFMILTKKEMRPLLGILVSLLFTSIMIEQNVCINFWIVLIILYLIKTYKTYNPESDIEQIL